MVCAEKIEILKNSYVFFILCLSINLSRAQEGTGSNTRGAKHQILVDRAVSGDYKTRNADLCTAWVDCKKTYDSVLRSWIVEWL